MRLWQRAAGAIKDKNSIWLAKLSRRTAFRNPDLEEVIVKATSHDETLIDTKNVQRVFQWVRTSPLYLKPLVWALSVRMQKTHSWAVALKGLMLTHGVLCCQIPYVQKVGRLPFDLSNFYDTHLNQGKVWGFNAFIHDYFVYLDQKSAYMASENKKKSKTIKETEETMMEELERLMKLQNLIDMLLEIKPRSPHMNVNLILEAMDCVVVEVFDVYGEFCRGIAGVLVRIYDMGGKLEARTASKILRKATKQGNALSNYFEFCKEIGVLNAFQCPKIERIPEADLQDLERIINNGLCEEKGSLDYEKAIMLRNSAEIAAISEQKGRLKTVITDKWEVFDDDDFDVFRDFRDLAKTNPFEESCAPVPYVPNYNQVLPDLITI